jgi:hypothetical protein
MSKWNIIATPSVQEFALRRARKIDKRLIPRYLFLQKSGEPIAHCEQRNLFVLVRKPLPVPPGFLSVLLQ